jgi:hypothetical protein
MSLLIVWQVSMSESYTCLYFILSLSLSLSLSLPFPTFLSLSISLLPPPFFFRLKKSEHELRKAVLRPET